MYQDGGQLGIDSLWSSFGYSLKEALLLVTPSSFSYAHECSISLESWLLCQCWAGGRGKPQGSAFLTSSLARSMLLV